MRKGLLLVIAAVASAAIWQYLLPSRFFEKMAICGAGAVLLWAIIAIAERRNSTRPHLSVVRVLAAAPLLLLCVPVFIITMYAGSYLSQPVIRAMFDSLHRAAPKNTVGLVDLAFAFAVACSLVAVFVWCASSILRGKWSSSALVVFVSLSILSSTAIVISFHWAAKSWVIIAAVVIFTCAMIVSFALFTFTAIDDCIPRQIGMVLPAALLLHVVVVAVPVVSKTVPAKMLPAPAHLATTINLETNGCTPAQGDTNSYGAVRQMAFSTPNVLSVACTTGIAFFDVRSGKRLSFAELSSNPYIATMVAGTANGQLLASNADKAVVYLPSGEAKDTVALPVQFVSPEGSTAASTQKGVTTLLRTDTLQPTGDVIKVGSLRTMNANAVIDYSFRPGESGFIVTRSSGWIFLPTRFENDCGEHFAYFLTNDSVLVTYCGEFSVVDLQGRVKWTDNFVGKDISFGGVSRDGTRFVLAVATWEFGDPQYLTDERFVVYDSVSRRPVVTAKARQLPRLQSWSALAPDGSVLAVGAENSIDLYPVH